MDITRLYLSKWCSKIYNNNNSGFHLKLFAMLVKLVNLCVEGSREWRMQADKQTKEECNWLQYVVSGPAGMVWLQR